METVVEILSRGLAQIAGRLGGPMRMRFFITPAIVTVVAILAGLRDARTGQPAFLWSILTREAERPQLMRSARKDVRRIFFTALAVDAVYQLIVLRAFYIVQALIVATACAVVPYVLFRGPTTRIARVTAAALVRRRAARAREHPPAFR